ncbi:MAG TPA: methyltransferase domain-containing protein [Blastocatellia bacterium]|nr:methyltransferase domain-containing protein [Blastocatellia bacterium]
MRDSTTVSSYERRFVPLAFDFLISTVFAPFGGIRKLRSAALDCLDIRPGMRVLELGCGTGGVTRLLLSRGAEVTCIDGSARMLSRARKRAPGARFKLQRLESLEIDGTYDLALFAFVLHELPRELRGRALAAAINALSPTGIVAVLDHAVPRSGMLARAWRAFLLRLEPPTVAECIEHGYDTELESAGVKVFAHRDLARGTVELTLAALG